MGFWDWYIGRLRAISLEGDINELARENPLYYFIDDPELSDKLASIYIFPTLTKDYFTGELVPVSYWDRLISPRDVNEVNELIVNNKMIRYISYGSEEYNQLVKNIKKGYSIIERYDNRGRIDFLVKQLITLRRALTIAFTNH